MTKKTAKLLVQHGGELRKDYSGRGMFGKTTAAVTFDSLVGFQSALMAAALELGSCNKRGTQEIRDELLGGFASDSMGHGIVVY